MRLARKETSTTAEFEAMDRLDRKILALYQNDTKRAAQAIGSAVGLSAAAVQRRLKRLREAGIIAGEIAVLDQAALGITVTCIVLLTMASKPSPSRHLDNFKREMRAAPEVQQCYHVTGTTDLVLVVVASSMEAYGEFARRWFEGNELVVRYETHVVLERVKAGMALPLDRPSP
jgi:DNA-binding Lrp family transcriptional regulator